MPLVSATLKTLFFSDPETPSQVDRFGSWPAESHTNVSNISQIIESMMNQWIINAIRAKKWRIKKWYEMIWMLVCSCVFRVCFIHASTCSGSYWSNTVDPPGVTVLFDFALQHDSLAIWKPSLKETCCMQEVYWFESPQRFSSHNGGCKFRNNYL